MSKKAKQKKNKVTTLPKHAPKKTGKRGVGPVEDANVKPGSTAAHNLSEQAPQGELIAASEPQPTVMEGRVLVNFLKPIFSKAPKSGDRLISLQMVVMLTGAHDEGNLIPKEIKAGWHFVAKNGRKRIDLEVPGQIAKLYLTYDDDEEALVLPAAKVTNCSVAVVQQKGEGEAVKEIRLSFRYQVPWSKQVETFAASNYGAHYWLVTRNTEETLFDDQEED